MCPQLHGEVCLLRELNGLLHRENVRQRAINGLLQIEHDLLRNANGLLQIEYVLLRNANGLVHCVNGERRENKNDDTPILLFICIMSLSGT